MYDQRLSNRENHRQLEGASAPPAINVDGGENPRINGALSGEAA
jgi:hypothetical protein